MAEKSEKRPRKPRRNFERELTELALYCRIKAEVLESIATSPDLSIKAEAAAYRDVLARLEPKS